MGDVMRFWCHEASNIRCVRESDFDAALSREAECQRQLGERWKDIAALKETVERQSDSEAALREELAQAEHMRTFWSESAAELDKRLTAAEQRNVDQLALLHMSKELLSTISLHRTMAPNDWCESFKNEVADRLEKLRAALKPTESGASE